MRRLAVIAEDRTRDPMLSNDPHETTCHIDVPVARNSENDYVSGEEALEDDDVFVVTIRTGKRTTSVDSHDVEWVSDRLGMTQIGVA